MSPFVIVQSIARPPFAEAYDKCDARSVDDRLRVRERQLDARLVERLAT